MSFERPHINGLSMDTSHAYGCNDSHRHLRYQSNAYNVTNQNSIKQSPHKVKALWDDCDFVSNIFSSTERKVHNLRKKKGSTVYLKGNEKSMPQDDQKAFKDKGSFKGFLHGWVCQRKWDKNEGQKYVKVDRPAIHIVLHWSKADRLIDVSIQVCWHVGHCWLK